MAKLPKLRRKDSTPTRQVTGTTYQATGAQAPPPANLSELGSAIAAPIREIVPELTGAQAPITYRKMARTNVSVRVSLRAGKAPVLGAEYFTEPFDESPESLAIEEFVRFNLFEAMTTPWLKVLDQVLKFYEDGNSVFEVVWEPREWAPKKTAPGANRRVYTMLRKVAVRPQTTIRKINYDDNGGPVSVDHRAIGKNNKSRDVTIPIEKLIIFTFEQEAGDLSGNSILRSAYDPWYYMKHLHKIDGIQKERHGIGVPRGKLPVNYTQEDIRMLREMLANIRTNEHAFIMELPNMEIDFAKVEGQLVDVLKSVEHHDNLVMKNIMVQFLNLGVETSSGGRATGATGMDMMLKAMRYVAQGLVCDPINMYLIPNLVAYNFQTDQFPKLKVRGVGEAKDMQMWASAMANLIDKGAITMDKPTEQWIRQQVDMPKKLEDRPKPETPSGPHDVRELLQGKTGAGAGNGSKGQTGETTGNVGKSPSSGAV